MDFFAPEHPAWEPTWKALKVIVGDLYYWEYMGPYKTSHSFRLRAGLPGNETDRNRYEYIPATVPYE